MDTKSYVLLTSAALVLGATTLGIGTALFGHNPESIVRLTTVASILGTGSIGLFFVGLAFPKPVTVSESSRALKD